VVDGGGEVCLHAVLDDVDGAEDEGLRESGNGAGQGHVGQPHLASAAVALVQEVHRVRVGPFARWRVVKR
jgi:hypothetical protein